MGTHIVTGVASGIGLATARALVEQDERVVGLVRSAERAADVRTQLPGLADVGVADLADTAAVQQWAQDWGQAPITSLIHCAGAVELGRVADFDADHWHHQLQVNLVAPAALTAGLLPGLQAAGGRVVFVNSTAGLTANATWGAYAASKAGLRALADSLRAEQAAHGVRVTSVFPSRTATPMQAAVHEMEGRDYDPAEFMSPESVAAQLVAVALGPADAVVTEIVMRPFR